MYCQKCGTQVAEGSAFCPKCGTKLMADEAVSQTTATPQHEPIASVSTVTEDTQQAQSNNATKVNGGLRKVANIGRVLMGISILLLLLCSLFSLPINPIIIVGGVAIGTILSALGLKRPFGMTKIIELVVACILLVAAIAYAVSSSGGGGDKYVQMVKGGTLDGYPQKTVGEAFDDFLDNPKWESGVTEDGERFVNVKGGILYLDKEAELAVQFFVDEKNEAFQYNACEINGVPQNNLIFWGLLEAIYSNNSASTTGVPQNTSSENRIEVGETQTFDGRLEVTLEYVEFVSQIQSELVGAIYPEDGNIFLRATLTVRNIGTKQGGVSPLLSTVTYDNSFEFDSNPYSEDGNITNVNPLAQPSTGSMSFEVSSIVAESDKSLVINISENVIGGDIMSFMVRPDANTSGESKTAYSVEFPLTVSTDAMNLFAEWAEKHPLVGNYHLDLISDDDVDDDGNKIFLFTLETDGVGVFNMSIRKSDGYMEYISKFDSMSMDEWYTGIFGDDDVETSSTNSGSVNSMEEAKKLVEDWMVDHPIGAEASVDSGAPANDIESVRAEYYVVVLWGDPENALGCVYVRKSDGYMSFQGLDSEDLIDLDEWYYALLRASNEALANW